MNYVGNHGIRILYEDIWTTPDESVWSRQVLSIGGCGSELQDCIAKQNGAVSNHNGLTVSLRRNFAIWFSAHANYTWAHNLDELSNGGLFPIATRASTPRSLPAPGRCFRPAAISA